MIKPSLKLPYRGAPREEPRRPSSGVRRTPAGAPNLVLVVEDDEATRMAICEILESEAFPTVSARNGREALDFLRACSAPPCMVLLDVTMPVMNGLEFFERAEHENLLAAASVVFMTARGKEMPLPAARILRKPFELDELLDLLRRAVPAPE